MTIKEFAYGEDYGRGFCVEEVLRGITEIKVKRLGYIKSLNVR